jgi:dihydroneopterin aldolase
VAQIVGGEPVDLLEKLADRIARHVLADDRVDVVRVTVHKPDAPIPLSFADVAVTIERAQQQQRPEDQR